MNADDWIRLGIALGLGGVIVELVRSFFQRRNMGANYAEVISRSAVGLLAPLEKRTEELEAKLGKSETRCRALHRQLKDSEHRADRLSRHLAEALAEVAILRQQVASITPDEGPHR